MRCPTGIQRSSFNTSNPSKAYGPSSESPKGACIPAEPENQQPQMHQPVLIPPGMIGKERGHEAMEVVRHHQDNQSVAQCDGTTTVAVAL